MNAVGQHVPRAVSVTGGAAVRVTRSRRSALWPGIAVVAIVVILGYLPYVVHSGTPASPPPRRRCLSSSSRC